MSKSSNNSLPAHALNTNVKEVLNLLSIHSALAGKSPGRKHNVEILNKSAIVLTVACWEAFVEDCAQSSLDFMIDRIPNHNKLPKLVLERVASKHTGVKAWDFAGDGWKKCLRSNLSEVLAKTTGKLNTPRSPQVNELFRNTIGLTDVSSDWHWPGKGRIAAEKSLDDLVTLRGGIAHRVSTSQAVRKADVYRSLDLVFRLAVKTSNSVRIHLKDIVGKAPWGVARFRKTR